MPGVIRDRILGPAGGPEPGTCHGRRGATEVVMNRPKLHWRVRLAVLAASGALLVGLFPMAGTALAATPTVTSINRASTSPTNVAAVSWTVVFSEAVTGVDATDFQLVAGGGLGGTPAISGVSGSGATRSVTATTGTGTGTLGLNLVDDDTILSVALPVTPLGGVGTGAVSTGQVYDIDRTAPTVTNVTSPTANGTYTAGTAISITVTFSEVVVVQGTPSLTLATGSPASTPVAYSGGSASNTLTFTYTVVAGNASLDLDYTSTAALSGTIADGAGNAATLTLAAPGAAGSLGANKAIVIDTTGPTVTINQAIGQVDPTKTSPINFTVVFSAAVTDFATGDVTLGGTVGGTLVGTVSGGGTTYNVAVTGMTTSGTVIASLVPGVANPGGHPSAASTSTDNVVTWDVTAPTVTILKAVDQGDPTGTSPIRFQVIFSESVTGFITGDVTLSGTAGATTAAVTALSGSVYNVAVSGMTTSGTVVASIAAGVASDAAGNLSVASPSSAQVIWDTTGPTVTINQASGQADPAATLPINFTVVFSAAVNGFDGTDVTLSGTATGLEPTRVVTGGPSTYNVAVAGLTAGTVTATIGADRVLSVTGNHPNRASTSTDNTVTYRVASRYVVTSSNYTPLPGSTVTITAQLADSANNAVPVSGIVVTWSKTGTGGTFSAATSTTNASGIATVTFTVNNATGTVHTVTASGGGFTGTSPNITVTGPAAVITLTRSRGMITYRESLTYLVQFGANGGSKPFILEYTSEGVPWTTIANLTTNSAGFASFVHAPTRTGYVRARFLGTPDLGAATSLVYIVGVRQTVSTLSPHHEGTKTIPGGTSVTFSTTVRPLRADLAPTRVTFRIYRKVSGAWVLKYERNADTDITGVARMTFYWGTAVRGDWYVRAFAPKTPYNSITRYTLREYYFVQ